jgi:hypothetical protein
MLKEVLCLAIPFITLWVTSAQDYRAVYSHRILLYEEEYYGQIRTLKIDSVDFISDSVFYPSPNIRRISEACYSPLGASWIGERIIEKQNGNTLFFNQANDTIVLNTKAGLNSRWIMCSIDDILFKATITNLDTMNFLGFTDSVKTISIQAYDTDQNPVEHSINNQYLLLSKHYCLVRTMNFYFFPDYLNDYSIYESFGLLNLVGMTNPEAGVQNIKWLDVHDFQTNDELHIVFTSQVISPNPDENSWAHHKTIRKYISRQNYPDSVMYMVDVLESREGYRFQNSYSEYIHDTIVEVFKPDNLFDRYPGQPLKEGEIGYANSMTYSTKTIPSVHGMFNVSEHCWIPTVADGCYPYYSYYKGLGGPYTYCTGGISAGVTEQQELVYYKKGDITWGQPLIITSAEKVPVHVDLLVYPNPSNGVFSVRLNDQNYKQYHISVLSLNGQVLMDDNNYADNTPIDLSRLSGTLLIKITTPTQTLYRKLVVY